jgi:putative isomerase
VRVRSECRRFEGGKAQAIDRRGQSSKNFRRERLIALVALMLVVVLQTTPPAKAATPLGYSADIHFDLAKVPFSRFGSYLTFSHLAATAEHTEGLYLRTMHGFVPQRELFRVDLVRGGTSVPFREVASPTLLRLEAHWGFAEIAFSDPHLIRVRGQGVELRLSGLIPHREYAFAVARNRWEVNCNAQSLKFRLVGLVGTLAMDAPWKGRSPDHLIASFVPDSHTGQFEGVVEDFESVWHPRSYRESFDASLQALQREYSDWLSKMPDVVPEFQDAANLAAYIDWESVVAPEGHFQRPAMLMSKNWMINVWSWDHCFNAMALIDKDPALAWDQFLVVVDNQNADGAFPDNVNDRGLEWAFSKPPIHGWAASWMLRHSSAAPRPIIERLYEPLAKWTNWYFQFRDDDGDGLPQYNHGNDSGWDNASVFRVGPPVETPDLPAFLVLQMEALSQWAEVLGKPQESKEWSRRADDLLNKLLAQYWKGDHFVALHSGDHKVASEGDSLILFLPLILGNRLPEQVRAKLVAGLKEEGRFLTEHGLATESRKSPFYTSDGYWLGPIWAPSTMIIIEGLDAVGEKALARDLRTRFCAMAARSGMAENFDAITGEGLRDPAYTWTSSVFLIFAHELRN